MFKRLLSLLTVLLALAPLQAPAGADTDSALLLVTGAYYDEGGRVLVRARPARVELPLGGGGQDYRLVEGAEQVFELRRDAYIAVPQDIPLERAMIRQTQAVDFPVYFSEFMQILEQAAFETLPPEKGDGILYTEYSLLYQAAVSGDSILSLTYHPLD